MLNTCDFIKIKLSEIVGVKRPMTNEEQTNGINATIFCFTWILNCDVAEHCLDKYTYRNERKEAQRRKPMAKYVNETVEVSLMTKLPSLVSLKIVFVIFELWEVWLRFYVSVYILTVKVRNVLHRNGRKKRVKSQITQLLHINI